MDNETTEPCKDCQGTGEQNLGCSWCALNREHWACDFTFVTCHCIAGVRLRLARKPVYEN